MSRLNAASKNSGLPPIDAIVTMKTEGVLLRLGKQDFIELLKKQLVNEIRFDEAKRKIEKGAVLLDVRTPQEFSFKHLPNALNIPLYDIREAMKGMDKNVEYIILPDRTKSRGSGVCHDAEGVRGGYA